MRTLAASVFVLCLVSTPALACGNKFLACGPRSGESSGIHFAAHPTSVLLYRNGSVPLTGEILDADFEFALSLAGHQVDTVESSEMLADALSEGKYRVVLAHVSDLGLFGLAPDTVVIPVADSERAISEALASAYPLVVTSSLPLRKLLTAIDELPPVAR